MHRERKLKTTRYCVPASLALLGSPTQQPSVQPTCDEATQGDTGRHPHEVAGKNHEPSVYAVVAVASTTIENIISSGSKLSSVAVFKPL
jgi:hypothetical protein